MTESSVEGVRLWRGGEIESTHAVHAAVVDDHGRTIAGHGDPAARSYLRSAAKPIQLLPLIEEGIADQYGFSGEELAIMAASHNAEPFHLEAVERILAKAGLEPELLQCGPHEPMDPATARRMLRSGAEPTQLHNNCSGKHAGMLALCQAKGWDMATYLDPHHPLQRRILAELAKLADVSEETIGIAVDGCGAPTFALPVSSMAAAWAKLAAKDASRNDDRERAVGIVFDAMADHPEFVAGTGRLCSVLMARAGERVVIKTGAEGVYCAAIRGSGRGVALKVVDGAKRAQDVALVTVLADLQVVDLADATLDQFAHPKVVNRAGRQVGHIDARLHLEEVSSLDR